MHDGLLDDGLFALELSNLLLHVLILSLLLADGHLQVFEVLHDVRVDHFHILVVLRRQMVLHQPNLLPQHLNLLLVLAQHALRLFNPILPPLDLAAHTVIVGNGLLRIVWPARCC